MILFNDLKRLFYKNIAILNRAKLLADNLEKGYTFDSCVKSHSSRINKPVVFQPYLDILSHTYSGENLTGVFPSKEAIEASDADSFSRYSSENFKLPNKRILTTLFTSAILAAEDMGLSSFKQQKMSIDDSIDSFSTVTSAAYPTYKKKGDPVARRQCVTFLNEFLNNPTISKLIKLPTTVFHRYQSKYKNSLIVKIRQVWALPYCIQSLQAVYFRNTIDLCKQHMLAQDFPASTYGRNLIDIGDNIISKFRRSNLTVASVDVTSFDSNIPFYFHALLFAVLELTYAGLSRKDRQVLNCLMVYECYTPYAYKGVKFKWQKRGIASGSLLTSFSGTFFTRTITHFIFQYFSKGRTTARANSVCLGDDNLFLLNNITLEQIKLGYSFFGLTCTDSQSLTYGDSEPFDFLGYKWDIQNRPTQTVVWFLVHFCYPQSFLKVNDIPLAILQTYRAISIAAPLYNGMKIFDRYIGRLDKVYLQFKSMLKDGEEVKVHYVGEDRRLDSLVIPLDKILSGGWRYYQSKIST